MPAPALNTNLSLSTLRDDLVFTESRLLADDQAKSQAKALRTLIDGWSKANASQLSIWDAQTRADALVSAADDALDDFVVELAATIRALPGGGTKWWATFFKQPPHLFASPVLGEQLKGMQGWQRQLESASEATLKALKKKLAGLLETGLAAEQARADADAENDHFRTRGDLAAYLSSVVKGRDAVFAALDAVAASDDTMPRSYSSRFFRRRTTKLSADEKKARADKKAADKQARDAAKAVVLAAQAKVKAAIAELKAAKKR